MKVTRPQGGNIRRADRSGARAVRRHWTLRALPVLATVAALALSSSASALILSGGPVDILPGGGSCSISGIASRAGGATISCSSVNLSAHTKVYFGLRNDIQVIGNTMTGSAPTSGSAAVFRYLSETATSITYTSSTTINDAFHGSHTVNNRLVLTLTSGSGSVTPAGGNPGNNNNGDIERVFRITSSSFSIRVDVQANDSFIAPLGYACPNVYDPSHAFINNGDISKVDMGFYYSDCGDGQLDSPEVCDLGGSNGSATSCCTSTCTFRPSGQVCRPGAGAPCDLSEMCTGSSSSCPPNDAPINMGIVCRAGSGDICDQNELCTGVPGQGCPADDAPGNTSIVCRAGSVGDICDDQETCTGVPGATCPPDDAPLNFNVICRPGSADVCDPDERCTGVPGQYCPPDVVANPSTVCRLGSGDMCDPTETCTAIPGQPCPPDVVTTAGTSCRSAVDGCDVTEACTGVAGETCPADGFASSGTACNVDGNVCTVDQCDGNGACVFGSSLSCDDGALCTQDSCDPVDGCEYTGAPSNSCQASAKAMLNIKNSGNDVGDKFKFLWKGGPVVINDMGDPTDTTSYELCVYDNRGVQLAITVPPGPGWSLNGSPSSPKGYKFKDSLASNDGVKTIKTKASSLNRALLKMIGKGTAMPDTAMHPLQFPITAQLYASDGSCWEAEFNAPETKRNDGGAFIGKSPP